jgi:membrane associated rhomboid family serine protease
VRAAQPPARERVRRWNASAGLVATKAVVGVNVAVFLLTNAPGSKTSADLQTRLALYGPALAKGEWWRLVTAGFVHYGLLHIAFNMVLLYRFGMLLEPALGRARFLALYMASLLAGSFGAVLLSPNVFTAGASGAVFGLFGAAAVGLRQRGIGVWQSGVGGLIVINLIFTFAVPGISIGGHLGGLAGGALVGGYMLRTRPSSRALAEGLVFAAAVAVLASAAAVHVASA